MTPITNNDVYLERMKAGLYDKTWWIDKINPNTTTIIDYGCACGDLFRFIEDMFPGKFKFIGIETNEEFLTNAYTEADYYRDIHDVECDWEHTILVMNSVIHEIYSYLSDDAFQEILNYVFDKGIAHVVIREMDLSYSDDSDDSIFNWVADVVDTAHKRYKGQWEDHLATYTSNETNITEQAVEFVLKYTYKENWRREVNERYLHSEMIGDIGHAMSRYNFHNENSNGKFYYFDYELPFYIPQQIDRIVADFGYFPDGLNTHVKLLISKGDLNE